MSKRPDQPNGKPPQNVAASPTEEAEEEAYLEAEAKRALTPLEGNVPADVLAMMRGMLTDAAATHPTATALRKEALARARTKRSKGRPNGNGRSE